MIDTWPGSATANHNPMFTIPPTDGSGFMFIDGVGSCAVTCWRADAIRRVDVDEVGHPRQREPAGPAQTRLYNVSVVCDDGEPLGRMLPARGITNAPASPAA